MSDQPNILLILTDHWRGDSLGRLGHPVAETPNLDALSAQGTTFTRAYTPSPSCVPARRALMTGKTPSSAGCVGYIDGKPWNYEHTLAGELANNGYQTMNVGKTHFHPPRKRLGYHDLVLREDYERWIDQETGIKDAKWLHGVNHNSWFGRPNHLPEHQAEETWFVNQAIDLLDKRDPTMPFFLTLSFNGPHPPYTPPQVYYDQFIDREMPEPAVGAWAERHDLEATKPLQTDAWRGRLADHVVHRARAAYYAYLAYIDAQIGRLFLSMGNLVTDNCLVVFSADHGEMLGDHNLLRKTYPYEGSARIPMIVRPPIDQSQFDDASESVSVLETIDMIPTPHNVELDHLAGLEDIMPTILDAAGIRIPNTVEGRSMMPLVHGEDISWRDYYHVEHSSSYHPTNAHQMLTDGEWKYIWNPITGDEQLFHLESDPNELEDLASDDGYGSKLAGWRELLVKHLEGRSEGLSDGEHLIPGPVGAWRG